MHTRSALLVLFLSASLLADPCGMVPPIFTGDGPPITRIGLQKTYVFYKDGVECFAIRPGFSGKVEDFGMLIPFPSPPALRKLPDNIFAQVAAAVDPPEVVEHFWDRDMMRNLEFGATQADGAEAPLMVNEVRVLREEAVGMYEVAVLEAGSAAALNRWMEDHGYIYPEGMDEPCNDYVAAGWCFVAIKTRVGPKSAVDPAPGQRETAPGLPAGGTFDGNVQAMGFRFETPELVVPMRLSAFNEGELRNVVYVLSDGPLKIVDLPESFVRRQVDGATLLRNLRGLRPLRLVGGTIEDLSLRRWKQLLDVRAPGPVNGLAAQVFASDLAAALRGELAHGHEEREKELLNIGEALALRGPAIDALHEASLEEERAAQREATLDALAGMTLTVIDADFPREHLASTNLTFEPYTMPEEVNVSSAYNAVACGPVAAQEGELIEGDGLPDALRELLDEEGEEEQRASPAWWSVFPGALLAFGLVVALRRRRR